MCETATVNSADETMSDADETTMSDAQLRHEVHQWLQWDKCVTTRDKVQQLYNTEQWQQLRELFECRVQFGTAGLRARVDAGPACLNELLVIQTSQGLAQYICQCSAADAAGVVVGFDARHDSRRFAELATAAFRRAGLRVWLYGRVCPTPWVAYGVRLLGAAAGVMITASHNPPADNGYKVYWSNGAQILPPHDSNIQAAILQQLPPHEDAWNTSAASCTLPELSDPLDQVTASYLSALEAQCARAPPLPVFSQPPVKMVLTAMHGVAHEYVQAAFAACHLPAFVPVPEQMHPDGNFPTVDFPNPEEGRTALCLAMNTADRHQCQLILANDPDADRLGVAERRSDAPAHTLSPGHWRVFNGNEIGALLGWWCWHVHQHATSSAPHPPYCHVIASCVSSQLLRRMAEREHFHFHQTLTGFKWMANKADQLENRSPEGAGVHKVLFAFEEAIGFMCGTDVLDKDGVSAAVHVARMALYLRLELHRSLAQQLAHIYRQYGVHVSSNSYVVCRRPRVVRRIFERLRHWPSDECCLTTVNGASYPCLLTTNNNNNDDDNQQARRCWRAEHVRDMTSGHDTARPDGLATMPAQPNCQMITWSFEGGCQMTLRTSGTEPKIKWYCEMNQAPPEHSQQDDDQLAATQQRLQQSLQQLVAAMQQEWLQVQLNELQHRSDD